MIAADRITVLTTPERADVYRGVFGAEADYVFDSLRTNPLDHFLRNLELAGGALAVVDEEHFISADVFMSGIKHFVDREQWLKNPLRLIVVCAWRQSDDELLAFLAGYCQIYDIIWNASDAEVMVTLERLLSQANSRCDIKAILACDFERRTALSLTDEQVREHVLETVLGARGEIKLRIALEPVNNL